MVVNVKCWMEKVDVPNGYLKKKKKTTTKIMTHQTHMCVPYF